MQVFVRNPWGKITILNVEKYETISTVKRKYKEREGFSSDLHLGLMYKNHLLEDGHTLTHYNILNRATFQLLLCWKNLKLEIEGVDTVVDDVKADIHEVEGIPPHKQLLFFLNKLLEDGSRTLADYGIRNYSIIQLAIQIQQGPQPNVTSQGTSEQAPQSTHRAPQMASRPTKRPAPSNAMLGTSDGEVCAEATSSLVLTELEDLKHELEATISGLTEKNNTFSAQNAALKAENSKIQKELTLAHSKTEEQESTISGLTHMNKVFLAQCASYESQVVDLEAEYKKTKEELMNAEKKYYSGARAAGYAEGLKEGKTKWLKSVEFLQHLTNTSVQYFNYGFDSCRKQAEEQGFAGQLNKNAALKDAPVPTGAESSDQPQ